MLISKKQRKLRNAEYYDLTATFDKLYAESKGGKVFTHLMDIICLDENILLAYRNVKKNSGSMTAGTDGLTVKDIEKIPKEKFVCTIKHKFALYKPKPVKRVEIPKSNGKTRPLGIPAIMDRIVQQCILQVLEPICEAKFYERSNGFRPNRSAQHALAQCYRMIQKQHLHFVVDIDIQGFFDNVNHAKLKKQIWEMGIRDKKLICIISEMLKAPIVMPDGSKEYPTKGTPQGGILSPLLSNIVLNELDWWVASQWENQPTHKEYKCAVNANGSICKSPIYTALRKSNLKEMYIVRYADDFKIFCRTLRDASKTFIAVKQWLNERLKLQISEEKSKVVNLKKQYSDFLGFKLKVVRKGNNYVVKSHMSDKALKQESDMLKEQVKMLRTPKGRTDEATAINIYNSMVWGIHNYYQYATDINIDCHKIAYRLSKVFKRKLGTRIKRDGVVNNEYIRKKYGASEQLRFIHGKPICPIGYIRTKYPMYKKSTVCKYTTEGRKEIHKNLGLDMTIMHRLMRSSEVGRSVEFMDNRISLYAAQWGKCAVTGRYLEYDEIHCHHIVPCEHGGKDNYQNLVIVHKYVHILIHANRPETIQKYLSFVQPSSKAINSINKYRQLAGLAEIAF